MSQPAVHRAILIVDVENFGDPARTNAHQLAVRDAMYKALRQSFARARISWAGCVIEDRGDGVLVLVSPEVPKSWLVTRLPARLADTLDRHNAACPEPERIRLRMALHAGEVHQDPHGFAGASINRAFRLVEAPPSRTALRGSTGVLALIVSDWFFDEVVRHHPAAEPSRFRQVRVIMKETEMTAWVRVLKDQEALTQGETGRAGQATTTMAPAPEAGGLPVAVPAGRLPVEIRGRGGLLAELYRPLRRYPRRRGGTWVLAGMGGLGKSTVALAVARKAQVSGWRVWWVGATDTTSLTGGMLEVLHQLRAPESVTRPVREGTPLAAERAWAFLKGRHAGGHRWLLIFDNADTPAVLAAHGAASPADYAGWVRPTPIGMVIVTTRKKDPRVWGPRVQLRELRPLEPAAAAQVLTDLAPGISDPGSRQASELGRRLGGLPLALHLAGNYLASPFARWHSFDDYRGALEGADLPQALADLDDSSDHDRTAINRTWEFSLDALAADGRPQARPLLWLLSCYAPATPILLGLLRPESLAELFTRGNSPEGHVGEDHTGQQRVLRDGLHGLATVGLIDFTDDGGPAVVTHPVVADASRSRLLTTAGSSLPLIAQAAVALLDIAAGTIDHQHPDDWPVWHQLTPHVTALLEWLAVHLDAATLERLLAISVRTAKAERRSGNLATAEKVASLSVAKAARLGDSHAAVLTARYALGQVVAAQGRNSQAEQIYRQVFTLQQRALGDDHADTLNTRHHLASMIYYQGRYGEAEEMYREVLAGQQQVLGIDAEATLNTRHHLAWMTGLRGSYNDAGQQFQEIIAGQRRVLGDDHPATLRARFGLAWVNALQGQYATAEQQFRQILDDQRRILGDDHPDTIDTRYRLARAITDQNRYREARDMYREVLIDRRRVLGEEHPATLVARDNLARVTGLQGRHREAEQMFRQVLTDRERLLAEGHPHALLTRHRLAQVVASQGRLSEAEQMFRQVLTDQDRLLGREHPATLGTCHRLAEIIASQGRNGEAEQMFRETLTAREKLLGGHHPDTICTRTQLSRITAPHKAAR
jgi:tetratricopeptide (TPR) repeat protein